MMEVKSKVDREVDGMLEAVGVLIWRSFEEQAIRIISLCKMNYLAPGGGV